MQDQAIIQEFLIESHENLNRLDRELVDLEQRPEDEALLASVFRTIHTMKGTCGFLGYHKLEKITHLAENILSQLRKGERKLTPEIASVTLEVVDSVRQELSAIETTGTESQHSHEDLLKLLEATHNARPTGTTEKGGTSGGDQSKKGSKSAIADTTIRVDVQLIDRLMNLVGELVLARNEICQAGRNAGLENTSQRLNLITSELQENVMKTRLQPIGNAWNKLPRMVRDISSALGKRVEIEMHGAETELDRSILEAIRDPLVHLVRNACDHGIEKPADRRNAGKPETGRLCMRAFHAGGQVNLEIVDDGKGMDPQVLKDKAIRQGLLREEKAERMTAHEALQLVFIPGFSTAAAVTNVSGRGVGMDVVRTNIEQIGGSIDLTSIPGTGTTIRIRIPLTLAIIPGLVISSGGERFVIPQASLLELVRIEGNLNQKIDSLHGAPVYRLRGGLLPLVDLNALMKLTPDREPDVANIVVVQSERSRFGILVDDINDTQEIVVKPLGKQLKHLQCYSGATIMGDGKVGLILDVTGIGRLGNVLGSAVEREAMAERQKEAGGTLQQTFLLFQAGGMNMGVPLALVERLEEFPMDRLESSAGHPVIQYRERILPLVDIPALLHAGAASQREENTQVIVFGDEHQRTGIMVDRIQDVVTGEIRTRTPVNQPGLLGSAVIGGGVVDLLDLSWVQKKSGEHWRRPAVHRLSGRKVLVAENSATSRAVLRTYLEMAGDTVVEAANERELAAKMSTAFDALMIANSFTTNGAAPLLSEFQKQSLLQAKPVIVLSELPEGALELNSVDLRLVACVSRFDRGALLGALDRLGREAAITSAQAQELTHA